MVNVCFSINGANLLTSNFVSPTWPMDPKVSRVYMASSAGQVSWENKYISVGQL